MAAPSVKVLSLLLWGKRKEEGLGNEMAMPVAPALGVQPWDPLSAEA